MKKYLYGQVVVTTVTFETEEEDQKKLEELAKKEYTNPASVTKSTYVLPWAEGGTMQAQNARNGVLQAFLKLMQRVIPMTRSEEKLIIPGRFNGKGSRIIVE